jgi:deoxyribonuclease-4
MISFCPAGQDEIFKTIHKSVLDMPAYLAGKGLNAFEYQCGHGVRISEPVAKILGENAKKNGVQISLHAPYYISLASEDKTKRENSIRHILAAARACDWMGGERVVIHPGGVGKQSREKAMSIAVETLKEAQKVLDEENLLHLRLCHETMGKRGQLGSLEETFVFCGIDNRMLPCIDFGHLNARSSGECSTAEQFTDVLKGLGQALGANRAKMFHAHFSKIEYTEKGGEKRHLTFEDAIYGPSFPPLAKLLIELGMEPTIICESAGTQIADAIAMKSIYEESLS